MEWARDGYAISDDPALVDRDLVHRFLRDESYWSPGIERATVERAIDNSMVFGVYRRPDGAPARQVGFARVVTDRARFAYLADVFIVSSERGNGLGTWLVETIVDHPELRDVVWWLLATRDAHGVYGRYGFTAIPEARIPDLMERRPGRGTAREKGAAPPGAAP